MVRRTHPHGRLIRYMMRRHRTIRRHRTFHVNRTNSPITTRSSSASWSPTSAMMQLLVIEDAPDFGDVGITMAQAKVLHVLAAGPIHMSELVARLRVTPSTTSGLVEKLVDQGLAARADDPADRRQVIVSVTAGRARAHGTVPRAELAPAPGAPHDRARRPTSTSSSGPSRSSAMPPHVAGRPRAVPSSDRHHDPTDTTDPVTSRHQQGSHQ